MAVLFNDKSEMEKLLIQKGWIKSFISLGTLNITVLKKVSDQISVIKKGWVIGASLYCVIFIDIESGIIIYELSFIYSLISVTVLFSPRILVNFIKPVYEFKIKFSRKFNDFDDK